MLSSINISIVYRECLLFGRSENVGKGGVSPVSNLYNIIYDIIVMSLGLFHFSFGD